MSYPLRTSLAPLSLLLGLSLACATPEAPYVRIVEPLGLPETPRVYVLANRDSQRVVDSLAVRGIGIAKGLRDANLLLRVRFGADRKQTHDCGQVRNLKYELRRANRRIVQIEHDSFAVLHTDGDRTLVLSIQGRGPTGRCAENIVDQASTELARLIGS